MDILTWNVQGAFPPNGSKDRIRNQIELIREEADGPDLPLLTEVTTVQREFWRELLHAEGYDEIVDSLDWAQELKEISVPPHHEFGHSNGNLIAIHESSRLQNLTREPASIISGPWKQADRKHWDTNFPEKILHATVEYGTEILDCWNIGPCRGVCMARKR